MQSTTQVPQKDLVALTRDYIAEVVSKRRDVIETYVSHKGTPSWFDGVFKFDGLVPYEGAAGLVKFQLTRNLLAVDEYYLIRIGDEVLRYKRMTNEMVLAEEELPQHFERRYFDIKDRIERAGGEWLIANHPLIREKLYEVLGDPTIRRSLAEALGVDEKRIIAFLSRTKSR